MLILDFVSLGFFWLSSISGGTPLNLGWGCAAECLGTWSCSRQTRQFCYPVPDKMVKKGQNDKKYILFQTEKLICRTCSRLREAKTIPCWAAHPCMAHISVPPPPPPPFPRVPMLNVFQLSMRPPPQVLTFRTALKSCVIHSFPAWHSFRKHPNHVGSVPCQHSFCIKMDQRYLCQVHG